MKICVISFHSCPFSLLGGEDTGGMNVYLRELSSALTDLPEHKIDIFTRTQSPDRNGIKNISSQLRVIHLKGGPEYPVERKKPYDFLPEFTDNLKRFILQEEENYDAIYTHYWLSGLVGEQIKSRFSLPLVHAYHTLAFLKKQALGEVEHRFRMRSEEHLACVSDVIVSSSLEEKKSLIREYGIPDSKVRIIYPGVNTELFYPYLNTEVFQETGYRKEDKVLLYIGRINPIKGLMTIIRAFGALEEKNESLYDQLKLVVVGGGRTDIDLPKNKEFIHIKKVIEENKLDDKVVFLGSKEQKELKKYYSTAHALIVPSLYESFGLVVVESLACGTPVIVSQIGKMKTIVKEGKNGFSFRPNEPDSLANCLEYFFSHKKNLWNSEEIRQDIIGKFSWEKTAKETIQVFSDLREKGKYPTTIFQPCGSPQPI